MNIMKNIVFENGLFIFRRDLRIIDNNTLNILNKICKNIYTIFIFTPEQVGERNEYKSNNAVQFMIESIEDLSKEITKSEGHLYTFYGKNNTIIEECIKKFDINIVAFNYDITPYSRERDDQIIELCNKYNILTLYENDYYLHQPGKIKNGTGNPYKKFTPYYNVAVKMPVQKPENKHFIHFANTKLQLANKITLTEAKKRFLKNKLNPNILVHGGRDNAIKQMLTASNNIKQYNNTRDDLTKKTSQLSAYIKFGCISIREVYYNFKSIHSFIRQIIWRDFYAQILYFFPYTLEHALKINYDKIKWKHNTKWFDDWKKGETGFPIVDACMRELNTTGYMHNRGRMIVSIFLVKTLLISWKYGAQYFSQKLTDYSPENNQLNWQTSASIGSDSQSYFRIINPWIQQKEHDKDCEYIKIWIPELREVPIDIIHNWDTKWREYKKINYPKPICDYKEQKEKAIQMYKNV